MTARVAHVPPLRPGETLSSQLLRLARNHSATGHELCALLWPQHRFWTRDIDRSASDELLRDISRDTGIGLETLARGTLREVIEATGFREWTHGCQRGILPVGIYHRQRRRFGQQYCSSCLAEKPAYLRRLWRLEFMVSCPFHGTLLRDACPDCGAPFIPHRNHSLTKTRCHRCASLLTKADCAKPDALAVMLQQAVLSALAASLGDAADAVSHGVCEKMEWPLLGDIGTKPFLDGLHRMCRLAARASGALADAPDQERKVWALLRTTERAAVMSEVWRWLSGWPDTWIRWASVGDLTQHQLDYAYGPWPDWAKSAIARLPYSHGPVNIKRSRPKISLSKLRKEFGSVTAYREARAELLLKKAGALRELPGCN